MTICLPFQSQRIFWHLNFLGHFQLGLFLTFGSCGFSQFLKSVSKGPSFWRRWGGSGKEHSFGTQRVSLKLLWSLILNIKWNSWLKAQPFFKPSTILNLEKIFLLSSFTKAFWSTVLLILKLFGQKDLEQIKEYL